MSDRPYVPGVSGPAVLGRDHKIQLARKLGPAIKYGLKTPQNPLGLYIPVSKESVESGEWRGPEAYLEPYPCIELDAQKRCNLRPDMGSTDAFTSVAGLVFGGMYAFVLQRNQFTELERQQFEDFNMGSFGAFVTAGIQREIARLILANNPNVGNTEIFRIIRASFGSTAGKLTHCKNDIAIEIEKQIGAIDPEETDPDEQYGEEFDSKLELCFTKSEVGSRFKTFPTRVDLKILIEEDILEPIAQCGGEYMKHGNDTLPLLLWNRVNKVIHALPWVIHSLRNELA